LNAALSRRFDDREAGPFDAYLPGTCFLDYRKHGGKRPSTLAEFFIAAHATVAGYRRITRDAARDRTTFPRFARVSRG
jgi:predicted nucleic acid-binding protein